jgi:serine/threonine protein kinase
MSTEPYTVTFDSNLLYQGIRRLGAGGFGVIILALHKYDNQLYAIKEVRMIKVEEIFAEAKREVEVLAILAKLENPNIVQYFTSWISSDRLLHEVPMETNQDELASVYGNFGLSNKVQLLQNFIFVITDSSEQWSIVCPCQTYLA